LTQALQAGVTAVIEQPEGQPTFPPRPAEATAELPTLEQLQPPKPEMPAVPETSLPEQYYYPEGYSPEEYAEYIVKERMSEVDQRMNELMAKHVELERKITEVKDQIGLITEAKPEQQMVVTKMDTFNESVEDMSIRLNSLEKAFKETLPALIESVRGLTDLIQRMKREA
jgi:predicted transcriptional regulator